MKHKTFQYILQPVHPVSIILIGTGGTGSHMLTQLARIHLSLQGLGHPGLFVTAYDDDVIEPHNVGRQMFSPAQQGQNKAVELITTINRYYGTNWEGIAEKWNGFQANIIITCTDTIKSRKQVYELWKNPDTEKVDRAYREMRTPYYWMDIGNSQYTGQVVMSAKEKALKNVFDLHPELLKQKDKKSEPTCSMAESLKFQDLFINSILAQYAAHLLWGLWNNLGTDYQGLYLNLKTLQTAKIEIQ